MTAQTAKRFFTAVALLIGVWLTVRYLVPLVAPFLIGGGIALAAEPGVNLIQRKWQWKRFPAVLLCVSLTLLLFVTLVALLGAAAVRELGSAAQYAPRIGDTIGQGMTVLEDFLVSLADRAPENIRPMLIQTVLDTFQGGNAMLQQATGKIPGVVAGIVGKVTKGVLTVGTGIIAGYMISVRLPRIRQWISDHLPENWTKRGLPALKKAKKTFGCWAKAQLKLMLAIWIVVSVGLILLKIPYGFLWAVFVAMVDAVPILGTGTILIPWAVVSFLQGNTNQGGGLMAIYGIASFARSILEPRLVGKSLGLDPLLSLAAVYIGFQVWGVPGLILAPVTAALIKSLMQNNSQIIHKETS